MHRLPRWIAVIQDMLSMQVLCQVPATVASKFFPPRVWLGVATIGWGACSTLMVILVLSLNRL